MARAFTECGFAAAPVTGETPDAERTELIGRLQDDADPLSILCSVDVLSEGIDIPDLTHILLLRPTQSPQVFLQQLGRGLRLHPGKEFVVVLDFVGNFEKNWVVPLALSGYTALPETKREALEQIEHFEPPAGWLRIRDALGLLPAFERSLLDGPGEAFLSHVEGELHPNKSYKMAVLHALLDIAEEEPGEASRDEVSRARKHILQNPLHFLSNSDEKFFVLDPEANTFRLKDSVAPLWHDPRFRALVRERVEYAEACYWYRWAESTGGET